MQQQPKLIHISAAEERALSLLKYAPLALLELDGQGTILTVNIVGEIWLKPIMSTYNIMGEIIGNNIFLILDHICPGMSEQVRASKDQLGFIVRQSNYLPVIVDGVETWKYYEFAINKMGDNDLILSFDDTTEKHLREKTVQQAMLDKAIEQSKYEVASGVLHDIGNAIVGFGSYLTRIRRAEERNDISSLQQLAAFFEAQQPAFAAAIGPDKAKALVDMLNGILKSQKERQEAIGCAVTEQHKIITHVQEILNIQRQYVTGHEQQERKAVNLRSIINDCMAMLFASFDKKGIDVALNLGTDSPNIKGDRTQLMQVVLNILKNSLDAIDLQADVKKVQVGLESVHGELVLTVRDSGCGFAEETGKRLFERGFTTKASGSGLGLHNCKAILESHDGTITITSEGEGKGALTEIRFEL